MILAVLANDLQKKELAVSAFFQKHEVIYSENNSLWTHHAADVYIDLEFLPSEEKIEQLEKLLPKPVLVNSVIETLSEIHPDFIRINGWPGFLKGSLLEAAAKKEKQEMAIKLFGDQIVFVKDEPGFVSARVVSMIINEAYFTWDAGISSKEEIDIAMKLGTGYPYGPFEWGEMIGIDRVAKLLKKLSLGSQVYELASSLIHVANM
ncbi:MAG TPA: 3-hydroxyacyl-CoA dehydrogenase family protein [Puia sp.]|jgi:3-hydroxybutyryl-CoA dehydrogenase|nr:3-hydroxyacyl-CoA dehydrogenase family protein [Puia sp.]